MPRFELSPSGENSRTKVQNVVADSTDISGRDTPNNPLPLKDLYALSCTESPMRGQVILSPHSLRTHNPVETDAELTRTSSWIAKSLRGGSVRLPADSPHKVVHIPASIWRETANGRAIRVYGVAFSAQIWFLGGTTTRKLKNPLYEDFFRDIREPNLVRWSHIQAEDVDSVRVFRKGGKSPESSEQTQAYVLFGRAATPCGCSARSRADTGNRRRT